MKSHRLARISEVIREVASTTILFELRDPRVKNITVTRAETSADLQHAKIYVSVMGTDREQSLAMHGLRSAAGFVQSKIAKQLATRFVPIVEFVLDPGIKKSIEISRLLREEKDRAALATGTPADTDSPDDHGDDAPPDEPAGP